MNRIARSKPQQRAEPASPVPHRLHWRQHVGLLATVVMVAALITTSYRPAAVRAANEHSQNVAYVFDDTAFPCGSDGCGLNDTSSQGGSIFNNALTESVPGSGNTGTYTPTDGPTVNLTNVPLSTLDADPSALSGYDTAILYETCKIGDPSNVAALREINDFLDSGHKLMIFDADACSTQNGGIGDADWSGFLFPFSTNSPGPQGAPGSYSQMESSSLTTGLSLGTQDGDSTGDANVFTTYNGSWYRVITAQNVNTTGIVEAYARSSHGGLAIYDGEDFWYASGGDQDHLRQVFDNILNLPWNPDNLPGSTDASGITLRPPTQTTHVGKSATVTAAVADVASNPKSGITVSFSVMSGPDKGAAGTGVSGADGLTAFSFKPASAGTDVVQASFSDSKGAVHTSNQVSVIVKSPAAPSAQRIIVLVHGINGNADRLAGFVPHGVTVAAKALEYTEVGPPLAHAHYTVVPFAYHEDLKYASDPDAVPPMCDPKFDSSRQLPQDLLQLARKWHFPINMDSAHSSWCDSQGDLGVNAVLLDKQLRELSTQHPNARIAIVANSQGGAITRGWLAFAQLLKDHNVTDPALAHVDTVIFFQGVQQGSIVAGLGSGIGQPNPGDLACLLVTLDQCAPGIVTRLVLSRLAAAYLGKLFLGKGFYLVRPAINELAPGSSWIRTINALKLPTGIHYFNFYTDIHLDVKYDIGLWSITSPPASLGDLVILPGTDTAADTPLLGGAKFLPVGASRGQHEWEITRPYTIDANEIIRLVTSSDSSVDDPPLNNFVTLYHMVTDRASHFRLGDNMANDGDHPVPSDAVWAPDCRSSTTASPMYEIIHNVLPNPNQACR